jgi:TolA-binding protein
VVAVLENFTTKYPQTNVAVNAEFTIVRVYAAKKEYTKAQDELKKIGKTFSKSSAICAEALFMRGAVYEDQGDWPTALAQYEFLVQVYPGTTRGLEAPMHIALRYKDKFQPDKMISALREAITHYQSLSQQNPRTPLDLQVRLLIARCYVELKEWENVARTLEAAMADFKGKVRVDTIMLDLAGIYQTQIKDTAKAHTILDQVIKDYPKTRSSDMAKAMLSQLDKGSK